METCVPRITVWHHEAYQVMTNGHTYGRIFLLDRTICPEDYCLALCGQTVITKGQVVFISNPHTNDGLLFLLIIKTDI